MDRGDLVTLAIGQLHRNRPGFAEDVQVGGNQAIGLDDEAGAQPLRFAVSAGEGYYDDRLATLLGNLLGGLGSEGRCRLHRPGGVFLNVRRLRRKARKQYPESPAERSRT